MTRFRLHFVFVIILSGFALILFRALQLQVLPHDRVERLAHRQLTQRIEIVGRRGVISDRNGRELAVSLNSSSVYANPKLVKDFRATSDLLARVLQVPREALLKRFQMNADRKFIWVKRQLSKDQTEGFKHIDLHAYPGVGLLPEFRREYPQGELASHILGFVSVDGKGIEGIERTADHDLAGEKNTQQINRDAFGRPIFSHSDQVRWEYQKGADVELTLDARLQFVAETSLRDAIAYHKAEAGTVIVMDPYNGELLAMATSPGFDPNRPNLSPRDHMRNRALSDPIEPGSTLKPFVVARAIEDKKVTPQTVVNTLGGKMRIGKHVISEAEKKHEFQHMTVADIIRFSSNVGIVQIKNILGFDKVTDTFVKLGFNSATGIELAGESKGIFPHPAPNQFLEQATMSFGQGIALTPLQITRAYATIANGGFLVKPTLVRRKDSKSVAASLATDSPIAASSEPETPKRIFSAETTRTMTELLERVVEEEGTGTLAHIDGFRVAGKTGTAQKVDFNHGGYEKGSYWSSFVGFVPSRNPRFVVYVMVDRPTKNSYYGGTVAAPVFSKVAREALRMHSPLYQFQAKAPLVANPTDVVALPAAAPQTKSGANPTSAPILNPAVTLKSLARGDTMPGKPKLAALNSAAQLDLVPDLQGLPLRTALRMLEDYPLEIQTQGVGYRVQDQDPKPGSALPKDARLKIRLN